MATQHQKLGITEIIDSRPYMIELAKCTKKTLYDKVVDAMCTCVKSNLTGDLDVMEKKCTPQFQKMVEASSSLKKDNILKISLFTCLAEDEAIYKSLVIMDQESKRTEMKVNLRGIKRHRFNMKRHLIPL